MAVLTANLTTDEIQAGIDLVREQLIEQYPSASVAPGSGVDGLVTQPSGYLAAFHTARANEALLLGSIAAITAGLTEASDADVDALASNYFITRTAGTPASGYAKIIVSANTPYVIQVGFELSFSDLTFSTTTEQRAYPTGTPGIVQTDVNRLMTLRADGKYEFTILVTADQDGAASRLGRGTVLTLTNPATGMVSSAVDTDFTGGTDQETNAELLARVQEGITTAVVAGPAQIQSLVTSQFPEARLTSLGVGSPLMTRDQDNLFGISTGGKLDCYIRSGQTVGRKTVVLNGTVTNAGTKAVSLVIPRPTSDGLYRVTAIRPHLYVGVGGITPASTSWATAATSVFTPYLPTTADRAFSANATVTVTFLDSLGTGTYNNGDVRAYDVDITYMPEVRDIADLLVGDNRPPGVDLLAKGGVPCLVQVLMTVRIPTGVTGPSIGTMQSLVANAINALDFGTAQLTSYIVHRAVASVLTIGEVTSVTFTGGIYCPNGTDLTIVPTTAITLPENAGQKVGAANTFFTCGVNDVSITLTT